MCTAVGMAPVLIPWGETIPALASGAVSGVSTSAVSGVDGKFWEFLKFFYPTNHAWSCQIVTINNDAWKKIKPEHQKAIEDLAKKLEPEFWAVSLKADTDSLEEADRGRHGGGQVPPADDEDLQAQDRAAARRLHQAGAGLRDAGQGLSRRDEALAWHRHFSVQRTPNAGAPAARCALRCSTASTC